MWGVVTGPLLAHTPADRNLSVLGGLVLLYAETFESSKNMFAGVPDFAPKDATSSYQVCVCVCVCVCVLCSSFLRTPFRYVSPASLRPLTARGPRPHRVDVSLACAL